MWLSAAEALRRLGSKPQTLYANVSRGRIRARPDPADARRSQYLAKDVDRLAGRARGRRSTETIASEAAAWGDPLLPTAISTVRDGQLIYRGADVAQLARDWTFEAVADLLIGAEFARDTSVSPRPPVGISSLLSQLAGRLTADRPPQQFGRAARRGEAARLFAWYADLLAGGDDLPIPERLAGMWRREIASAPIRRALILLADHELNPSTFAARVTVSTGAPFSAGLLSGLGTLMGARHGNAARFVTANAEDIGSAADVESHLRSWLGEGRELPGFGHRLYPGGDVRARVLLEAFEMPDSYRRYAQVGRMLTDDEPNIDFALAALTAAFSLPQEAPLTLFALGRSAGWLAHMIEQVEAGQMIRPRGRYVGPVSLREPDASR